MFMIYQTLQYWIYIRHIEKKIAIKIKNIVRRWNIATFDISSINMQTLSIFVFKTIYVRLYQVKEPLRLYGSFTFHPFPVKDFLGKRVVCIWIVTSAIWRRSVRDRVWRLWLEKVHDGCQLPQLSKKKVTIQLKCYKSFYIIIINEIRWKRA